MTSEQKIRKLRATIMKVLPQIGCGCGYFDGVEGLGGSYTKCKTCLKAI